MAETYYCEIADIKAIFPADMIARLVDDDDSGTIEPSEDDIIQECIYEAAAIIDGHIGGRLALPLVDDTGQPITTSVLKRWTRSINQDLRITARNSCP